MRLEDGGRFGAVSKPFPNLFHIKILKMSEGATSSGRIDRWLDWIKSRDPPASTEDKDRELTNFLQSFGKQVPIEIRLNTFGYWLRGQSRWDITRERSPPTWADDQLMEPVWWGNADTVMPCPSVPMTGDFKIFLEPHAIQFVTFLANRPGKPRPLTVEVGLSSSGTLELSANNLRILFYIWLELRCRESLLEIEIFFKTQDGLKNKAPLSIKQPLMAHIRKCFRLLERLQQGVMTLEQMLNSLHVPYDGERVQEFGSNYIAANGMGSWASQQLIFGMDTLMEQKKFIRKQLKKAVPGKHLA